MAKGTKPENPFQVLEEKYGKNSIVLANSKGFDKVKEVTSTGSFNLDRAIGIGGIPKGGKITQILGGESASKTTLSLHIIANEQKKGNLCAFLDVEGTLDLDYAQAIGVDLSKLYLVDVEMFLEKKKDSEIKAISGEEWLDVLCDLLATKQFGIIVVDSVAELCPMSELAAGMTSAGIGPMARMMSKSLRGITAHLLSTNTGLILLNQYRMSPGKYGDPRIEATGEALKFYTALKIEISKSLDKDANGVYGIVVKAKITKSKVAPPFKECEYYVEFGRGIDRSGEIIDLAVEYKLIDKGGSWYTVKNLDTGEQIHKCQGEVELRKFLEDNGDFMVVLEEKVIQLLKGEE